LSRLRSTLSRPLAALVSAKIRRDTARGGLCQQRIFRKLIAQGRKTAYGNALGFDQISSYDEFRKQIPLAAYESLSPYIERASMGEADVLWPGHPKYFAKTSGTTSGSKYIPITPDSIHNHINTARNALLVYMKRSGNCRFADHSMIFLQGSPILEKKGVIPAGRLSGIVAHHVPAYLQKNRMPSWETNCIENWEEKVDAIVEETLMQRMSLISGIPSWLRMYFEKLAAKTGKSVGEVFPDFSILVYGGLNYEPYREGISQLIGRNVDTLETYPASEGFIAFQDGEQGGGLLLNVNSGIFFEFIPMPDIHKDPPPRLSLEEVEKGVDYAIVLSSNAGLWAYELGDTVRFVSLHPHRILVTGRVSQFISAFGEHVIASEVEAALAETCKESGVQVAEFTVAPRVNPTAGLPHHEWLIEFGTAPTSMDSFAEQLDRAMRRKNPYYDDLVKGKVLQALKIKELPKGTFRKYMEKEGKLGGQNKVIHVADNRRQADGLLALLNRDEPPPSSPK
jgi:hypothetical protein